MKIKTLLFCITIITAFTNAVSQDDFKNELFGIHPKVGYNYSLFLSEFDKFEGINNCGSFGNGVGKGIFGGLFFEKNFKKRYFAELGIVYINRSGNISAPTKFPSRDMTSGEVVWVNTNNTIEAKLGFIEIQPQIGYMISEKLISGPLKVNFGFRAFIPITANYNYFEKIVSPSDAVFINQNGSRSQQRDIASGKITTANKFGIGLNAGIENYLRAGRNSYFTQHIQIDYNLTSILKESKWGVFAIRAGVGYRFGINEKVNPPKTAPRPKIEPPVQIQKPIYADDIKEVKAETTAEIKPELKLNFIEKNLKKYYGNELLATIPIVNAVFFEQNSSSVPDIYLYELPSTNFFHIDALEAHNYLFPRIADILKKNPKAKIELIGSTNGEADEPEGQKLAMLRAKNVAEALEKCGVPEKKITVRAEVMPNVVSNQEFNDGRIENRRVDIMISNAPMQEYVDFLNFAEVRGDVKLQLEHKGILPDQQVEISSEILDNPLKIKLLDLDNQNIFRIPIKMRVDDKISQYNYSVYAKADKVKDSAVFDFNTDKLEQVLINQDLSNFKAILRFDYNSSELSQDNKGLLKQLAEKLPAGAVISILGSADALGTQARNEQLISERAKVTSEYIENINPGKFKYRTGMNKEKFPEASPQGRFLNRSIIITITKQ